MPDRDPPTPPHDTLPGGDPLGPAVLVPPPPPQLLPQDDPPRRREDKRALVPTLRVVAGRDVLRHVTMVAGEEFFIGRDADNGLPLADPTVSRRHARVVCAEDGSAQVTDLDSTNGTSVNGLPVHTARLRPGDRLDIGAAALRLDLLPPEEVTHLAAVLARLDNPHHEPLTGLLGAGYLVADLPADLERARRSAGDLSAVLFAIDDLAGLESRHGRKVVDDVLRVFARLVLLSVRDSDPCIRHGAADILVIVGADEAMAARVAERVRRVIAHHDWRRIAPGLAVTLSAAATQARPEETAIAWIERTEDLLALVRRSGSNRVETPSGPCLTLS